MPLECSLCLTCLSRQAWERQARALLLLCAGVLGSRSARSRDGLLELAAARLLVLLQDADSWACFGKGRFPLDLSSCAVIMPEVSAFCMLLARMPMPSHAVNISRYF